METELQKNLQRIISKIVSKNPEQSHTIFDTLVNEILEYYNQPVHSLSEMKSVRKTKTKGDLWEYFCKLYLQKVKGYHNTWLLHELPDQIREQLGMSKRDYGIDIVAEKNGRFTAVQCKFKKPRPGHVPGTWIPYNCVNWKELSTFYALCAKTNGGKWEHQLVLTNTKYVRHMGKRSQKDRSYCRGTFSKMTHLDFVSLIENTSETSTCKVIQDTQPNEVDIRAARLKYFGVV